MTLETFNLVPGFMFVFFGIVTAVLLPILNAF